MNSNQIFQTNNKTRWNSVKWASRVLIIAIIVIISVVTFAVIHAVNPSLPNIENKYNTYKSILDPNHKFLFETKENKKYHGFASFLKSKIKEDSLHHAINKKIKAKTIRAAFYTPWSKESLNDLKQNAGKLNTVFPEWFFINPKTFNIEQKIDTAALNVMRKKKLSIHPMLTNYVTDPDNSKSGFSGDLLHKILNNKQIKAKIIAQLVYYLNKYKFQGVNIDFEEIKEPTNEPLAQFQKEIYQALSSKGYIVSVDVEPKNEDYNYKSLGQNSDFVVLMAYDEFSAPNWPGPISGQKWIEEQMDWISQYINPEKIILGVAGYGLDWTLDDNGEKVVLPISYSAAINAAKLSNSSIYFDDNSYNLNINYDEFVHGKKRNHNLWFTDAATTFNVLRFADDYSTAGTALWRLGSEDPRIWTYYGRDMSTSSLKKYPFNFNKLKNIPYNPNTKPTPIGEGELIDVLYSPQKGQVDLTINKKEILISEQNYKHLPSGYIYQKFAEDTTKLGPGHKIVLTFDDGPNPKYTPRVLDILKKYNIKATFFVVGINVQDNIPLLKRIYDEGHEIGNHTFTHNNVARLTPDRTVLELNTTRSLIECITGHSTVLFRAPYNADSEPQTYEELEPLVQSKKENYISVGEGIDPNDWDERNNADDIYNKTIALANSTNASIVLLHDSGGNTREPTVEALPRIIEYFKKRGCKFVTVSDLMGKSRNEVMPKVPDSWSNKVNLFFVEIYFWINHILFTLFFIGIILSISRIIFVMIIAFHNKKTEEKLEKLTHKSQIPYQKPLVSVIVPSYNEEVNCVRTVKSLLNQDYENLEIIFVDDGSKDSTYEKISEAFGNNKRVKLFTKTNGGKATALNFGIAQSNADYVVCIDADTQLKKNAVSELMEKFTYLTPDGEKLLDPTIGAVAGNVKVANEINMIAYWQSIEYITAQNFDRRAFDTLGCITVVPGAIGAFYKKAILDAGGFTSDTLAEDCDLTMKLLRKNYIIRNSNSAISYTEVPETLKLFLRQRFRWSFGVIQAFWKHKKALLNPKEKNFGMIAMPNILIFQIILPFLAPLADIILVLSLIASGFGIIPASMEKIILYYLLFTLIDLIGAIIAFNFEKEKYSKLIWLFPQKLVYRQLMYYILIKSIRKALKGELQGWGAQKRTGKISPKIENI